MLQVIVKIFAIPILMLGASASLKAELPESLSEVLAANGCQDISGDARVQRFGDPWWVSLEATTGDDRDYALFCQAAGEEVTAQLILVVRGDRNPWGGCDSVVNSWGGESQLPFRYSVKVLAAPPEQIADLSQWWLVSSSRDSNVTFGSEGTRVSGPIIDTSIGAGTLYACESGEWYRIGID